MFFLNPETIVTKSLVLVISYFQTLKYILHFFLTFKTVKTNAWCLEFAANICKLPINLLIFTRVSHKQKQIFTILGKILCFIV